MTRRSSPTPTAGDRAAGRGPGRTAGRRLPHRDDAGMTTAFMVVLTTALLACAGLVLDGGLALSARVEAVDLAQEAARAGAQELDLTAYRATGRLALRPDAAAAAARQYLAAAAATAAGAPASGADNAGANTSGEQITGEVTTTATTVTVTVHSRRRTQLLALIGIGSLTVSGHASATARTRP